MIRLFGLFFCMFVPCTLHELHAVGPLNPPSNVPGIINYQGRVIVGGVNFAGTGQFKFALVDGGVNQSQTATANATVAAGQVTQILVVGNGNGYTSAPAVTITGDGTGATAFAVLGQGMGTGTGPVDSVYAVTITNAGSGYTFATVTIAPPTPNITVITYWSNDSTSVTGSEPAASVALGVNAGLYAVPLGDTSLANMQTIPASVFQNADVRLRVWFDDGAHGSQLLTPDQRITAAGYAMLANTAETVLDGAITSAKLANASVGSAQIANGAISPTLLAAQAAPQAGQMLSYNATNATFEWIAGGLSLPFSGTGSSVNALVSLTNTGSGSGIYALGVQGDGVFGKTNQAGASGVYGRSDTFTTGQGVYGYSAVNGVGVLGVSEGNDGISGRTNAAGKSGVFGFASRPDNNAMAAINSLGTGIFAKTEGGAAAAGYFWNSAGGDAIRTDGKASLNGDVIVAGGLAVGSTVITSGSEHLACGHWNAIDLFPGLSGTHLFQVGNGSAAIRKDAFGVYDSGDCFVGRNLRVGGGRVTVGELSFTSSTSTAAFGKNVTASFPEMFAVGRYNESAQVWDPFMETLTDPLFVVGNGTSDAARTSALAVYSNGLTLAANLVLSGAAAKPGGGMWSNLISDGRWKDIKGEYHAGLNGVAKIRPVFFNYKDGNPEHFPRDKTHLGVIAQEMQGALPDAVITRKDGYLTVDQDQIFWAMVNAIKELKVENDAVKKQFATENAALKARLEALEAALDR